MDASCSRSASRKPKVFLSPELVLLSQILIIKIDLSASCNSNGKHMMEYMQRPSVDEGQ